jgi:hypothetical protein
MRAASGPWRALATLGLFASTLFLVGCGGGPKLVTVKGKLYVADELVPAGETVKGYVILHPDGGKGNTTQEQVQGILAEDGSFTVFTRDKEGAPPGWYKVTVDLADVKASDPYYYRPKIDDKYLEKDKSGLAFEVVENPESDRYDIKLPPRKK